MGTLRGDNGGERPQDGNGVPDLPPEWGTIVIPDDPAELDDEGAFVRRRFRQQTRKQRWRRRFHLRPQVVRLDDDAPGLAVPLLIMTIAVMATLTSLFAVAWPAQRRPTPGRPVPATAAAPTSSTVRLNDVTLVGASGEEQLSKLLPAVILLVDDCPCGDLIADTAVAVSSPPFANVSVLIVGTTTPALPSLAAGSVPVQAFADAKGTIRAQLPDLASGSKPAAVLLGSGLAVVRVVPTVNSVADFRADLVRLK
jgi:hypothetical protein